MDGLENIKTSLIERVEAHVKLKEKYLSDGVVMLPNAIVFDKKLSVQAKALLLALVAHAFLDSRFGMYEKRDCRVSHALLKEELKVSEAWISKYSQELKRMGYLEIIRTGRSSVYFVSLSAVEKHLERIVKHVQKVRMQLKSKI